MSAEFTPRRVGGASCRLDRRTDMLVLRELCPGRNGGGAGPDEASGGDERHDVKTMEGGVEGGRAAQ